MSIIQSVIEAVIVIACLGYFRWWMGKSFDRLESKIDRKVDESTCRERIGSCAKLNDVKAARIIAAEKQMDEIWSALNRHGHKGLSGDDNQVVRT